MRWQLGDRKKREDAAKKGRKRGGGRAPLIPAKQIPAFVDGHEKVISSLKRRLEKMQIRVVPRPKDSDGHPLNPLLPPDLTALDDEELGCLYGQFCQMVQYIQLKLAVTGVKRVLAERAEKYVRAKTWLLKTGTVGDKEAQVEVEESVQQRSLETLTEGAAETMEDHLMQVYLMGKEACSRELTRRLGTTQRGSFD